MALCEGSEKPATSGVRACRLMWNRGCGEGGWRRRRERKGEKKQGCDQMWSGRHVGQCELMRQRLRDSASGAASLLIGCWNLRVSVLRFQRHFILFKVLVLRAMKCGTLKSVLMAFHWSERCTILQTFKVAPLRALFIFGGARLLRAT